MKDNWLRYLLVLWFGFAFSARAQLQFTNVTTSGVPKTEGLYAVTCGGAFNAGVGGSNYIFVVVGGGSNIATLTFSSALSSKGLNASWMSTNVPGVTSLAAGVFGGNKFLVSGVNNTVFSSPDALSWTKTGTVFANSATAQGLAYNSSDFVAVASAPEIGWTTSPIPGIWSSATITNISFADSFFGVTAFNLTNATGTDFAACGVLGRLAISSDGGRHWATPSGQIGLPDLNGIASDGGKTLVGVGGPDGGSTGSLLTFIVTNSSGGTVLVTNVSTANTLNAVSFIGSNYLGGNYGFLAVGANGSVLMSTNNGTRWTNIKGNYPALASLNTNLNGVFFANSGIFKGVGVLVGVNGTIVLAGSTPPVPTNSVGATNSAFFPLPAANNPLSVTLVTNDFFPAGTLTVDWFANPTGGNPVTNGAVVFYPPDNPANVNSVYINTYYAQTRDLRTGFVNPNRVAATITIYPRPTSLAGGTNEICNGYGATITNVLTGIGPWTVYWTNGVASFVQYVTNGVPGSFTNTLALPDTAFSVTNSFPNQSTNYYFWVYEVISSNLNNFVSTNFPLSVTGTNPPDLKGTNLVIVDPRPTSTSITTNEICNTMGTTITNVLSGIGPWTVYWTNGVGGLVQSVTNSAPGYFTNTLALTSGMFGLSNPDKNQAVTNYYWVAQLVSENLNDGYACTNWAGDLIGTNAVVIDPLPTSTTGGTNEICNGYGTTLTNVLSGIGPWTVYWTNGFTGFVQSVTNSVPGYFTNTLTLTSGLFGLTNSDPNHATNIYYWVTQVVSSNFVDGYSCANGVGGLSGTNVVVIDPRPTSTSVTTNEICNGMGTTLTNVLTGIGPWTVYWTNVLTGSNFAQSVPQTLSGPFTNTLALPNPEFSLMNTNPNQAITNYYAVAQLVSGNLNDGYTCTNWASDLSGTNAVIIDPLPTSTTGGTNVICNGESPVLTNILSGIGPWTVYWTDGITNFVEFVTNRVPGNYTDAFYLTNSVFITTNLSQRAITNYYWVTQVVSSNLVDGSACTNSAAGLSATNVLIIDPVLQTPPVSSGDVTSCYDVPVPLSVSVPAGFTVDWYNSVLSLVAAGTNVYVPPVPVNLGGNASVTNTFMAVSRFIDPSRTNCYSPAANISLISVACTNAITSIKVSGQNVVIQWSGNYFLESTTNLVHGNTVWTVVANQGVGTNYLTNSITLPPIEFFRLTTTTN
ncbi:MAG TPA: hypothetical protein VNX46_16425 [Candidatus Acidoferrum sp.]|nr:hypothetical protein [Candidatus Acidoferrum sp.]